MNVGKCARCKYEAFDSGKVQKQLYNVRFKKTYKRKILCKTCLEKDLEKGVQFLEVKIK